MNTNYHRAADQNAVRESVVLQFSLQKICNLKLNPESRYVIFEDVLNSSKGILEDLRMFKEEG